MPLLLHVCCGPCLLYPAEVFRRESLAFTCYFFNPNIHPFQEFKKRLETFKTLVTARGYPFLVEPDYGLRAFLRSVVFNEDRRCSICYLTRLEQTARLAKAKGFDSFSSTLLYSRYQNHHLLKTQSEHLASLYALPFFYRDFRLGWQKGVDEAVALTLYRQPYCGCLFSEQERYDNRLKKQLRKRTVSNV